MKTLLLFSLIGVAFSYIVFKGGEYIEDESWHTWKAGHNKYYSDFGEEKVRYSIWQNNYKKIVEHNKKSKSLFLEMNHFGDMTNAEFRAKMNGFFRTHEKSSGGSSFLSPSNLVLPDQVDWREHGLVSEVKNQGQCGSCWAFSTTGALEGQYRKKTGKDIDLSEQNLVDCSTQYGNHGCQGGLMDNAFKYIRDNHGIDTEKSYPYEGKQGDCRFNPETVGAEDTGFIDIDQGNEHALKNGSASVGPISIAIDASHFSFQFYRMGVYDEPNCSSTQLDHGVLLVGYGVEKGKEGELDKDYWLVKNSWGERWGEKGYVRMSRNKNNQCGVASSASFPLV